MEPEIKYMKAALREARKAEKLEEVPIGCVIVQNDKIIARGYNRRNTDKNTLSHAELTAIKKASKKTGDWRLVCDLRTMPDVRGSHCAVPYEKGGNRNYESQSRMRRVGHEPFAGGSI